MKSSFTRCYSLSRSWNTHWKFLFYMLMNCSPHVFTKFFTKFSLLFFKKFTDGIFCKTINSFLIIIIIFQSQDLLSRNVLSNIPAPKAVSSHTAIDRWSDCIGPDRDSRHLGKLSTILQHFTHNESSLWNPVTHCCSLMSLCAAGCILHAKVISLDT
jgi:hypothetical protein